MNSVRKMLKKSLITAILTAGTFHGAGQVAQAQAPVDCAMFLCIPGGWPASSECAAARAVFVQRATPFPVLPPFQPWNCPMNIGTGPGQVDLSTPAFNFLRAIRVWEVSYFHAQRGKDEECDESGSVVLGQYNDEGRYVKSYPPLSDIPIWIVADQSCQPRGTRGIRAVGLEWRDHENNIGREIIHY